MQRKRVGVVQAARGTVADILMPTRQYVLCPSRGDKARIGLDVCKARCRKYNKCEAVKHAKGGDANGLR